MRARYKRILVKMSGEALMGERSHGTDEKVLKYLAEEIKGIVELGIECGIVIGGGNICRGYEYAGDIVDRTSADYIGMLATVMNSLILQSSLTNIGIKASIQSGIEIKPISKLFSSKEAIEELESNKVLILGGGTGNPYFTTDTAGVLRALELKADILIKATKVDGIYSADPNLDANAIKYENISYSEYIDKSLKVMDKTAVSLCQENKLPVLILDMLKKGNIKAALKGNAVGSIIGF